MRRVLLIILIGMSIGLGVAGCNRPAGLSQKQLVIATGSKSGVYYPVGEIVARVIKQKFADVQVQVIESQGSLQNLTMLREGKAHLALVQNDIAHYAVNGRHMFSGNPFPGLQGLATLFPEVVHIVARADSGIASLSDLAGKRVGVGTENSGTFHNAMQILERAHVWDRIDPQKIEFGEEISEFEKGHLDAFFFSSGVPNPRITDLAGQIPLSFVPVDPDLVMEMVNASPSFYFPSEIPYACYPGVATAVPALEINALLIANSSLNENDTYLITKNLFSSLPGLRDAHKALINVTPNSLRRQMTINMAPGARQALSE